MIKVGACFSGIGGLELGFEEAGCEVVFQVEIDAACQRTLKKHWPDVALYDDIEKVNYERLRRDLGPRADVDVLIGGWPCQDISLAGRRAGLAGHRSGLFFQFARLAKEIAPRWLVAENVPGLLSSFSPVEQPPSEVPAGREWEVDETHDLGVVVSTLAELGYMGAWRCLDAQHFGVPQRRRRIFFVCHLGAPFSAAAEVLLERDSGVGDSAEGEEAWEDDAEAVGVGVDEPGELGAGEVVSALTSAHGGPDDNMAQAGHLVPQAIGLGSESSPDVASTLGATSNGRGWNNDLDRMGALVIEDPVFIGSEYGDQVARPLTAPERGHRYDMETENLLVDPRDYEEEPYTVHSGDDALWTQGVAQPVIASKGWPGAVTFRKSQRAHTADDCETWLEDEVANTLNGYENHNDRRTTHAIVEAIPVELRMATRTSGATGVGTPGAGFGEQGDPSYPVMASPPPAVQHELSVRRLTPLECERLQGFPDGWTEGHPDSTRYKQLGNAVAVVCSRWIARRLVDADRRIHG